MPAPGGPNRSILVVTAPRLTREPFTGTADDGRCRAAIPAIGTAFAPTSPVGAGVAPLTEDYTDMKRTVVLNLPG
jgi:hypothetical protein